MPSHFRITLILNFFYSTSYCRYSSDTLVYTDIIALKMFSFSFFLKLLSVIVQSRWVHVDFSLRFLLFSERKRWIPTDTGLSAAVTPLLQDSTFYVCSVNQARYTVFCIPAIQLVFIHLLHMPIIFLMESENVLLIHSPHTTNKHPLFKCKSTLFISLDLNFSK